MASNRYQYRQLCVSNYVLVLYLLLNSIHYRRFYYGGTVGNELGASDPVFMRKYGKELEKDSGKWIDSSVWHGKAHTWDKIKWLIGEVRQPLVVVLDKSNILANSGIGSREADHLSSRVSKMSRTP